MEKAIQDQLRGRSAAGYAEATQTIVEDISKNALNSSSGQDFLNKMSEQYGTFSQASQTILVSYLMGSALGGTSLGDTYTSKLDKQTAKLYKDYRNIKDFSKAKQADILNQMKAVKAIESDRHKISTEALRLANEEGVLEGEIRSEVRQRESNKADKGKSAGLDKQFDVDEDVSTRQSERTEIEGEKEVDLEGVKAVKREVDVIESNIQESLDIIVDNTEIESEKILSDSDKAVNKSMPTVQKAYLEGSPLKQSIESGFNTARKEGFTGSKVQYKAIVLESISNNAKNSSTPDLSSLSDEQIAEVSSKDEVLSFAKRG